MVARSSITGSASRQPCGERKGWRGSKRAPMRASDSVARVIAGTVIE
jgi:hypothetical protein